MIAAMANNRVIGADNKMPWHLPADLAHFKRATLGKPVVMGRKTYESIGKALPGRLNIVVTQNNEYSLADATVVSSCEQAIEVAKQVANDEVMIIGGGTLYQHFLPLSDRLYLTQIDLSVKGDTYFPDYNANAKWQMASQEHHSADPKNKYNYTFQRLDRA
jgi:dihydrofolate reductase